MKKLITAKTLNKARKALKNRPIDSGLDIKDCPFSSCTLNTGDGGCFSTNKTICKEIPDQFNEDK